MKALPGRTMNSNAKGTETQHPYSSAAFEGFGRMIPATAYDAEHPPVHNPDAEALLRRFLSEVSGYRQAGNAALQELEARLTTLSEQSTSASSPLRSAPDMRYTAATTGDSEERSLEERLRELTGHLHADLSRYESMNDVREARYDFNDTYVTDRYSQPAYTSESAYDRYCRNAPAARQADYSQPASVSPVLDRAWFEERFAVMRASVDELAEKIPTKRMDALEKQFQQLMERLDRQESLNSGAEAVEAGLKRLATYLEDSRQLAGQHDERVRNVEERIEKLSGLVEQSHAAIVATSKGIECVVRNTGPRLPQQTAELVAIQIQERLAQLQINQPSDNLNREIENLSTQSRQQAHETNERLKELTTFLTNKLASYASTSQGEPFSKDEEEEDGEEDKLFSQKFAVTAGTTSRPLSSAAAGQAALREAYRAPESAPQKWVQSDSEDDDAETASGSVENSLASNAFEEGDDYDRELIAAAQRAARLAEGPKRDVSKHGEPIKYQIPYHEFLPDDERKPTSHLGLVVAVAILLLASIAMLYLNLREKDGQSIQSSAPDLTTVQRKKFATQQLPSVPPLVTAPSGVLVLDEAQKPEASKASTQEKAETGVVTSTETITPVVVQKASGPISAPAPQLPGATVKESVREAAVKGEPNAQFSVGQSYLSSQDPTHQLNENERLSTAVRWFRRAAEGGHAASQYRLGTLYEMGQGAPKDLAEAEHWYRLAAEAGHVKAMHNIAVLAISGRGGMTNYITAAKWFAKAAEYGLADSQYNLAVLYERGLGVSADRNKAYEWYALAAKAGDEKAAQKRDALAEMLTPADKVASDAIVETWKRRTPDSQVNGAAPEPPVSELSEKAADAPEKNVVEQKTAHEVTQVQVMKAVPEAEVKPNAMILEAQRYLSRLGFYSGPKDGVAGPRTASAVRRFELHDGFVPTGRVTEALLVRLAYLQD